MGKPIPHFKFSGVISPQDPFHQVTEVALGPEGITPEQQILAPKTVSVTITNPPPSRTLNIPQYSPTVIGTSTGYNPAGDCNGYFMSAKFKSNNNCYAYGCNIATNSYPQPGRASGNYLAKLTLDGLTVRKCAELDGLKYVGTTFEDIKLFAQNRIASMGSLRGHFVALLLSPREGEWPGDYHWVRCDENESFSSWSQKDGGDEITNFDFAGNSIKDPSTANWTVNLGPAGSTEDDIIISYVFYCYMFVPDSDLNIV